MPVVAKLALLPGVDAREASGSRPELLQAVSKLIVVLQMQVYDGKPS